MPQIVPINDCLDAGLIGLAKSLASAMESGARPMQRCVETESGRIIFQKIGNGVVRALVDVLSSALYRWARMPGAPTIRVESVNTFENFPAEWRLEYSVGRISKIDTTSQYILAGSLGETAATLTSSSKFRTTPFVVWNEQYQSPFLTHVFSETSVTDAVDRLYGAMLSPLLGALYPNAPPSLLNPNPEHVPSQPYTTEWVKWSTLASTYTDAGGWRTDFSQSDFVPLEVSPDTIYTAEWPRFIASLSAGEAPEGWMRAVTASVPIYVGTAPEIELHVTVTSELTSGSGEAHTGQVNTYSRLAELLYVVPNSDPYEDAAFYSETITGSLSLYYHATVEGVEVQPPGSRITVTYVNWFGRKDTVLQDGTYLHQDTVVNGAYDIGFRSAGPRLLTYTTPQIVLDYRAANGGRTKPPPGGSNLGAYYPGAHGAALCSGLVAEITPVNINIDTRTIEIRGTALAAYSDVTGEFELGGWVPLTDSDGEVIESRQVDVPAELLAPGAINVLGQAYPFGYPFRSCLVRYVPPSASKASRDTAVKQRKDIAAYSLDAQGVIQDHLMALVLGLLSPQTATI